MARKSIFAPKYFFWKILHIHQRKATHQTNSNEQVVNRPKFRIALYANDNTTLMLEFIKHIQKGYLNFNQWPGIENE